MRTSPISPPLRICLFDYMRGPRVCCLSRLSRLSTFPMAVLPCRTKSSDEPRRSSGLYARQGQEASSVTANIPNVFHNQLSMISAVHYTNSLSLSVAYYELRHTKIPRYRARARRQLQENCAVLRALGSTFSSAVIMAHLGGRVMRGRTESFRPSQHRSILRQLCQLHVLHTMVLYQFHLAWSLRSLCSLECQQIQAIQFMHVVHLFLLFNPNFDLNATGAAFKGDLRSTEWTSHL